MLRLSLLKGGVSCPSFFCKWCGGCPMLLARREPKPPPARPPHKIPGERKLRCPLGAAFPSILRLLARATHATKSTRPSLCSWRPPVPQHPPRPSPRRRTFRRVSGRTARPREKVTTMGTSTKVRGRWRAGLLVPRTTADSRVSTRWGRSQRQLALYLCLIVLSSGLTDEQAEGGRRSDRQQPFVCELEITTTFYASLSS